MKGRIELALEDIQSRERDDPQIKKLAVDSFFVIWVFDIEAFSSAVVSPPTKHCKADEAVTACQIRIRNLENETRNQCLVLHRYFLLLSQSSGVNPTAGRYPQVSAGIPNRQSCLKENSLSDSWTC